MLNGCLFAPCAMLCCCRGLRAEFLVVPLRSFNRSYVVLYSASTSDLLLWTTTTTTPKIHFRFQTREYIPSVYIDSQQSEPCIDYLRGSANSSSTQANNTPSTFGLRFCRLPSIQQFVDWSRVRILSRRWVLDFFYCAENIHFG